MAASTTTTKTLTSTSSSSSSHLKFQNQPIKSKRCQCRYFTLSATVTTTKADLSSASSSSASSSTRKLDRPTIVSPDNSCCCSSASKPISNPPPPPPPPPARHRRNSFSPSDSSYPFRIRFSPGSQFPVMDFTSSSSPTTTAGNVNGHHEYFHSSFTKFNSALNVGLISPMFPPPPSPDKTRTSPNLFEMMANEPYIHPKTQIPPQHGGLSVQKIQISPQYQHVPTMHRISDPWQSRSPGNKFNDLVNSDIKLTLSSKDEICGSMNVLKNLEATPWAEEEEEKEASLLSELHVEGAGASEVPERVSIEVTNGPEENKENNEGVLLKLLQVVLEGKDEKATREMKGLVFKMLRENPSHNELEKEPLYIASDGCLQLLRTHVFRAADSDLQEVGQIARQADNLYWLLDILIVQQISEDFLKTWASQSELSEIHSKIPPVHRFEISKITARCFIGIGKGQILASKDVRFLLLKTWLDPFYDDFGWMRRGSKGIDPHLIEDGLSNTILTLPLAWQQEILLGWFDRFMRCGEDCPNIQRGFEVWWRRAFWRRGLEQERTQPLKVITSTFENL